MTRPALRRLTAFLVLATLLLAAAARAQQVPQPPLVAAKSWLLLDARTGTVLAAQGANDRRLPIASLTKMMTTYVADVAIREGRVAMTDQVRVSEHAWRTGMDEGSRMYLDVGSSVSVEDLFRGIIIQSGNDASVALAEHIAGSEGQFVQMMNAQAKSLGLSNTQFLDASGLDDNNFSTAQDLATLARHIVYDFPENYRFYAEKEFRYNIAKPQQNRNELLWRDPSVDGLKTGHTEAAGYCSSPPRSGETRLVSVVLNTASKAARADESAKLLDWGFRNFETYAPYPAGTVLGQGRVWMGEAEQVQFGLGDALVMTVPRGEWQRLKASMTVPSELHAPITKGQKIASLVIRDGDRVVVERPLVAMQDVPEANVFVRIWHWFRLLFAGLFG